MFEITSYISNWKSSYFAHFKFAPWQITAKAPELIRDFIKTLDDGYKIEDNIAVHTSATVENGAIIKGPVVIGPDCYIAATAYLRGGVFLEKNCTIGPACEVKTTFMFSGSKVAHLSFVGDSLIGSDANIEAGAIVANYRNEMDNKRILIQTNSGIIDTETDKFGALVGDHARIGANAVIAPGALISPELKIPRLALIDQHPASQP